MAEKDYISRELAKKFFTPPEGVTFMQLNVTVESLLETLDNIPAADVREVKRGFNTKKDYPSLFECSICGWECWDTIPCDTETFNFCPNCGAEMRGET